jgi:hypothetical protein
VHELSHMLIHGDNDSDDAFTYAGEELIVDAGSG